MSKIAARSSKRLRLYAPVTNQASRAVFAILCWFI
jgi:hypothetical protein